LIPGVVTPAHAARVRYGRARQVSPLSRSSPELSPILGLALLAGGCSAVATGDAMIVRTEGLVEVTAPLAPVVYAGDRTLSPLSSDIAQRLHDVISTGPARTDVVAKIGDSLTAARSYLGCFDASEDVKLDGRDHLRPTIEWFTTTIHGAPSWSRPSLAAGKGWAAFRTLYGDPPPIDRELAAANPAFATVMFGTNDIQLGSIDRYGRNLLDITDLLLARGVVPILSTIPPRGDDPAADAWVPPYNAVVRAVAQARQVPLIDLHRELATLRGRGLTGDHVHLASHATGCWFTPGSLAAGNNRRNLLTLEMLDRLRRAVLAGERAPDDDPPRLTGDGSAIDPFTIPSLPFGDGRDTRRAVVGGQESADNVDLSGGSGEAVAGGRGSAVVYRIDLAASTKLRGFVIDRRGRHALHVQTDPHDPSTRVRGNLALGTRLAAGTYYAVVETRGDRAGEYLLALTR
jgi:hypothetical protein